MALTFADKLLKWGYEENNGPDKWHEWFPVAQAGARQSPIDIVTTDTRGDLGPLRPRYRPATLANVENTSKSFQVNFFDKGFALVTAVSTRWTGRVMRLSSTSSISTPPSTRLQERRLTRRMA